MPIWKFQEEPAGEITLEDASLELSAYYQALEDLLSWLSATDGIETEDLCASLLTWAESMDDLGAELSAYLQQFENAGSSLQTVAQVLNDLKMHLEVFGLDLSDLSMWFQAAGYRLNDMKTLLQAVSPTVLINLMMFLSSTDGTILNDCRMRLNAVRMAPAFQSIVAQRLSANIHEV